MSNGIAPAGVEYYLPLFFEHTALLTDYLPPHTTIVLHGDVQPAIEQFWQDTQARFNLLGGDRSQPLLPPRDLFLSTDAFFGAIKPFTRVEISAVDETAEETASTRSRLTPHSRLRRCRRSRSTAAPTIRCIALQAFIAGYDGRVLLVAEALGRRETMLEYFTEHGIMPAPCASYAEFLASDAPVMLGVGAARRRFRARRSAYRDHH